MRGRETSEHARHPPAHALQFVRYPLNPVAEGTIRRNSQLSQRKSCVRRPYWSRTKGR
ncbi:hypothetical protein MPLSOD_40445 [Mesorhizobium sp. SOD10]|nr:hypothetical protein MPLSOD_40445 [Mesorhizobium sp. SOD10]